MYNYAIIDKVNEICSWMEDEKSKIILKQRLLYSLTGDIRYIYDMFKLVDITLKELDGKYESEIRRDFGDLYPKEDLLTWLIKKNKEHENTKKQVWIFGCGKWANQMVLLLNTFEISITAFADNYKSGEFCGKLICYVEAIPKDAFVIISSYEYRDEMLKQLLNLGYRRENIFYPEENTFFCACGTSYFDEEIFEPRDEEIFVDAGCFHGETSKRFAEWAKSYKGILAFEPEKNKLDIISRMCEAENIHNLSLVNAGLGSKNGRLAFSPTGLEGCGSHFDKNGTNRMEVAALDSLANDKISFLKMDIEGSELEALIGAKGTIQRDKPRMAICIYHKPEDIWEIPQYIKSIVPEYHMAVRHYMTYVYDTILYCWI